MARLVPEKYSTMKKYIPIECGLHSEYELAIMRGYRLHLHWSDGQGCRHQAVVKPVDIFTHHHEEFLRIDMKGERIDIRLDHIIHAEGIKPSLDE